MKKLVSDDYSAEMKRLHSATGAFGAGMVTSKHYPGIVEMLRKMNAKSLLDYGCGKGHFLSHLRESLPELSAHGFDVASEEYGVLPDGLFDVVVSLDVMEHVEFGLLNNVLSEIRERTGKLFICSVANYPAAKKLSDGRNAHVSQMPFGMWFTLLSGHFRVDKFVRTAKAEALFMCSVLKESSDWR